MAKTLSEYYDANIKHCDGSKLFYNKIKSLMKTGEKNLVIPVKQRDVYTYPTGDYVYIDGVYIENKEVVKQVKFARVHGLGIKYLHKPAKKFLRKEKSTVTISWG